MIPTFALCFVASALAWVLASRRAEYRPIAMLLTLGLLAEAVELVLAVAFGHVHRGTTSALVARLAFDAASMAWPCALVGAALVVFTGGSPRPALFGWLAAVAVFAVVHPSAAGGSQARALATVEVVSALIAAATVVGGSYRARKAPASTAQRALQIVVATEVLSFAGVMTGRPISSVLYPAMLVLVIAAQSRWLWLSSPRERPAS
jgi:hypothetical protein